MLNSDGLRLRPIVTTAATLFAGLLPIMLGAGTGADKMRRIAAPMIGGTLSTLVLTMLLPVAYYLWRRHSTA